MPCEGGKWDVDIIYCTALLKKSAFWSSKYTSCFYMTHKKSKEIFYIIGKLANIKHAVPPFNNKSNQHDYFVPDRSNFPLKACSVKACFNF